ncbi:related to TNA1 - high affinity nicotinic acid plasma membrane permease [Ustilago sp. UG-2017a]|nr:related to TNA1 - high affinity nicotinic acid plasma membrane permease [Ustilago sp. UG-2017a]
MGEKLTKDPLTLVEDSPGRSSGQQDTHDAISIDRISATNGARPLDPTSEEYKLMEKKLIWKVLGSVYKHRNSITAARDNGLVRDLNLLDTEYQTALSILYVGYITFQIPSNMMMTKLGRPSVYIATFVVVWGIVSACTAAATGYHSLLAISGLISAAILKGMEGKAGLPAWKWLFILEGIITVVIGVCAVFILPDMPGNSKFLTPEERQMAVNRLCLDAGTSLSPNDEEGTAVQGFIMAVKDIKVWVLAFMLTAVTVGVGFNQFFPTIVGSLGYSKTVTLLLTAPIWFFAFLACLANGLHSDRTQERSLHIIIPLVFGIVGFIIAATTTGLGPRFFALFIEASSYAGYTCVLALALINAFSQLGNISASYVWPKKWGPKYWQSNTISAAMFVACIALVLLHRTMLSMENKELDRIKADVLAKGGSGGLQKEVLEGKADEESGKAVDAKSKKAQTRIAMAKSSFRYML